MIEIKMPEEEEMPPKNNSREEAHSIIKLLVNAYNMGYKDGVEAYKAMMELEKEEKEEHDGCVSCKFEDKKEHEDPCRRCCHNFTDKWRAKE